MSLIIGARVGSHLRIRVQGCQHQRLFPVISKAMQSQGDFGRLDYGLLSSWVRFEWFCPSRIGHSIDLSDFKRSS